MSLKFENKFCELKKIILICGKANSGKTTFLNRFIKKMTEESFVEIDCDDKLYKSLSSYFKNKRNNADKNLSIDNFIILQDISGVRVGIITEGDYAWDWLYILILIIVFGCVIVIGAVNISNGGLAKLPISEIINFSNNPIIHFEKIDKKGWKNKKDDKYLQNKVEELFKIIEKVVREENNLECIIPATKN